MLDFYGPVHGTGPIHITNQVPDNQIERLIQTMERLSDIMAKISDEIDDLENELEESSTVLQGTNALIDRFIKVVETNIGDEKRLREATAALKARRTALGEKLVAGTAAADELEKEDAEEGGEQPS